MPKYFDPILKRPRILLPVIDRSESLPEVATPLAKDKLGTVPMARGDSGAGRTEQALRKSSHAFRKFQQATQTYPVEAALSDVATDASITLRAAMSHTSELLAQYQALAKPGCMGHSEQAQQRTDLSGQILKNVAFEFDCMDALTDALDGLQRIDTAKLVVARDIAGQAGSQQAKLTPLLARREQQSADFQVARGKDARLAWHLIDCRTSQIADQLRQAGILAPD
jgi:hypothetical protein